MFRFHCAGIRRALVFDSCRNVLYARRFNSDYSYITDLKKLFKEIDQVIAKENATQESILEAITACAKLRNHIYSGSKIDSDGKLTKIDSKIIQILGHENTTFNNDILKKLFLLKLPATTNVRFIEAFYDKNPKDYITKTTALVALRSSLFDADIDLALKISDLTVGHDNYVKFKGDELRSGATKLFASTIGIAAFANLGISYGIETGLINGAWASMSSLYAMIFAYILNSSFFAAVVKFGRVVISGGGDYLTWQKGVFYNHWWKHSDELLFCSKIVETDIALNSTGTSSQDLIEELCRTDQTLQSGRTLLPGYTRLGKKVRLLAPKDNLNELLMQAYWMSGGDGFEWVEPDQEPADLIWRQHLEQFNHPRLQPNAKKTIGWADDLINSERGVEQL